MALTQAAAPVAAAAAPPATDPRMRSSNVPASLRRKQTLSNVDVQPALATSRADPGSLRPRSRSRSCQESPAEEATIVVDSSEVAMPNNNSGTKRPLVADWDPYL